MQTTDQLITLIDHPERALIAEQYSRMVELAIAKGQRDRAHAVIDIAFRAIDSLRPATDDTELECVLPERIAGLLIADNLLTVGDVRMLSDAELLAIPQVRQKTIDAIRKCFLAYGVQ